MQVLNNEAGWLAESIFGSCEAACKAMSLHEGPQETRLYPHILPKSK